MILNNIKFLLNISRVPHHSFAVSWQGWNYPSTSKIRYFLRCRNVGSFHFLFYWRISQRQGSHNTLSYIPRRYFVSIF
jgi:hypothetical protein